MTLEFSAGFKKSWKRRIAPSASLTRRAEERLVLFQHNVRHPFLRDHALTGKQLRLRAFSITSDIRVVYLPLSRDRVLLLDIGTHDQVY